MSEEDLQGKIRKWGDRRHDRGWRERRAGPQVDPCLNRHGKNFSIFLEAGGRFALTPIYDVISAHPLMARGELPGQKAKMAMALRGKSPHYTWDRIRRRHWLETAKRCGFPEKEMEGIVKEVLESLDGVIERVARQVPDNRVEEVAQPIFAGMRQAREMFAKDY